MWGEESLEVELTGDVTMCRDGTKVSVIDG